MGPGIRFIAVHMNFPIGNPGALGTIGPGIVGLPLDITSRLFRHSGSNFFINHEGIGCTAFIDVANLDRRGIDVGTVRATARRDIRHNNIVRADETFDGARVHELNCNVVPVPTINKIIGARC